MDGHNFGQRDLHVAAELAGVAPLRLHDARHSYASWLRQAGVALEEIQRLLGHASSVTTQRYAALGESQYDQILAALNGTPISGS